MVLSEHSEFRWIELDEVEDYEVVPDLLKAISLFKLGH
jgi:hypothetical protein